MASWMKNCSFSIIIFWYLPKISVWSMTYKKKDKSIQFMIHSLKDPKKFNVISTIYLNADIINFLCEPLLSINTSLIKGRTNLLEMCNVSQILTVITMIFSNSRDLPGQCIINATSILTCILSSSSIELSGILFNTSISISKAICKSVREKHTIDPRVVDIASSLSSSLLSKTISLLVEELLFETLFYLSSAYLEIDCHWPGGTDMFRNQMAWSFKNFPKTQKDICLILMNSKSNNDLKYFIIIFIYFYLLTCSNTENESIYLEPMSVYLCSTQNTIPVPVIKALLFNISIKQWILNLDEISYVELETFCLKNYKATLCLLIELINDNNIDRYKQQMGFNIIKKIIATENDNNEHKTLLIIWDMLPTQLGSFCCNESPHVTEATNLIFLLNLTESFFFCGDKFSINEHQHIVYTMSSIIKSYQLTFTEKYTLLSSLLQHFLNVVQLSNNDDGSTMSRLCHNCMLSSITLFQIVLKYCEEDISSTVEFNRILNVEFLKSIFIQLETIICQGLDWLSDHAWECLTAILSSKLLKCSQHFSDLKVELVADPWLSFIIRNQNSFSGKCLEFLEFWFAEIVSRS
ncbi:Hypothetical protein CINCED_3A019811 [Cinara cedri]|uniref:Uncharacterized protein n=1 Tax=Cinara cedri TaxID=506608 RepID=A0A5E4M9I1_9HEMI|nr:Hypothetical protein CINCED_3A019811 [Cinara cedri]